MAAMHRNKSVDVHQFAMIPRAEIPRSTFRVQHTHKTTFDAGYLIPVYVDEVLPGDSITLQMTAFTRLSTPLFPIMDNLHLDSHFFFVPNRLLWSNWQKFMGQQTNPGDSISFLVPSMACPAGGYAVGSLHDYMGLPTTGQIPGGAIYGHNSLHLRAYNLIWNEWYRSEDLQNSVTVDLGDGPDTYSNYVLLRRGKRHDYFTSCLPSPQKAGTSVSTPIDTSTTVKTQTTYLSTGSPSSPLKIRRNDTAPILGASTSLYGGADGNVYASEASAGGGPGVYPTNLYADLSTATAATINQLRQAFQ